MKDLVSKIGPIVALAPAIVSATATSAALDLLGFKSAVLIVQSGAIESAGDFTVTLQESDTTTSGDFTDVAAGDLEGELPDTLAADTVYKLGYTGTKRYLRAVATKNGGTSIGLSITLIKGHPESAPVA
ncbi:hypothetical protein BOO69_08255 [Sulfitobacter alexandrii]|uniref:Uncharacterized protein n=1 Tax=Sulfitobacter alexandrii TaxID=1917485 RepID=A0A1J0WGH0_9RHOB|nr:hypothetical protein [Sulfitobacter alexandrii]APE43409.1 hypothetical protein BOO69_08255 [Sulfitobacter alexandrii]